MSEFNNDLVNNKYREDEVFDEMIKKKKNVRPRKSVKMYTDDWSIAYQVKAKTGENLVDIISEAMALLKEKHDL
ncbi:TPA: hypothetical protein ACOG8R_002619 [Staphylococcus aureus]